MPTSQDHWEKETPTGDTHLWSVCVLVCVRAGGDDGVRVGWWRVLVVCGVAVVVVVSVVK